MRSRGGAGRGAPGQVRARGYRVKGWGRGGGRRGAPGQTLGVGARGRVTRLGARVTGVA